ncbi:D-alanyl-D-alanine carboxypeptidase [Poseidonocella pacifica]|uniref:D-alanyl-D-alanine carboxypeptidase n=1 Tax=Poseidonocella pacifica TaxID=871651 RepID=A0A1I0XI22_9RHOB|nr:D-alanyl-D-alanine carboxypeptidase family protein [Poseidonocella pacifica]SFB00662.1 D-alanyl-D-alanine carboxypeptidase [Poseidonocella pacifica]
MKAWLGSSAHRSPVIVVLITLLALSPISAIAAPYAAMVMDARTGEVLHSRNADTRLHPASLTKMMTLYTVFQAIEAGKLSLDQKITISANAAAEPPSKLGLRKGQTIALRYLIRAAAVKSANDAATALGEAVAGSEAAFARHMNRTAKSLGMTRTTFKNAHGLTEQGHLSTARDMSILGRHMLYDYPEYYNLFSRRSTHAGLREVANTNRRFLAAYKGADGIKTGYTRAAGFNLVASAERGQTRIIATMFGGRSTAQRNERVAELLDMGFARAPRVARLQKPHKPGFEGVGVAVATVTAVKRSLFPQARPIVATAAVVAAMEAPAAVAVDLKDDIAEAVALAATTPEGAAPIPVIASPTGLPPVRPAALMESRANSEPELEVVTRISSSGGRLWGINVGRYGSRYQAERILLQTALTEMSTLDGSLRKVVKSPRGYDAHFVGMTQETAALACRRLQARQVECSPFGPS